MEDVVKKLCIVIPCYNEEEMLPTTFSVLRDVLQGLIEKEKITNDSFLLFVDDGSKDTTWKLICAEHEINPIQISGLKLSRNVGHQFALTAGLLSAKENSDMVVSMDADLQDDVSVIEEMIDLFYAGNDIVYGVRKERNTDTFFKRTTAQLFYKMMHLLGVKTVYNHADFRLMSKRALEEFSKYKETNLFLRGMMPMLGFQTAEVYYDRKERRAGTSKYPLRKMLALAFDGISSFSIKPISMILGIGIGILALTVVAFIYALLSYMKGQVVAGWTSLILSIWFLGGLQLFAIGLVGQYIGKIYMEVKQRPRYHVETELHQGKESFSMEESEIK